MRWSVAVWLSDLEDEKDISLVSNEKKDHLPEFEGVHQKGGFHAHGRWRTCSQNIQEGPTRCRVSLDDIIRAALISETTLD